MKQFFPFYHDTLGIESHTAKQPGAALAPDYQSETPYHDTCTDNVLPEEVITRVREETLQVCDMLAENLSACVQGAPRLWRRAEL